MLGIHAEAKLMNGTSATPLSVAASYVGGERLAYVATRAKRMCAAEGGLTNSTHCIAIWAAVEVVEGIAVGGRGGGRGSVSRG